MRRSDLPDDLPTAFTVTEAASRGVPASRLRGLDLDRPFRGMRVRRDVLDLSGATGAESDGVDARMRADIVTAAQQYALVMPANQLFTHLTAAVLWNVPLPSSAVRGATGLDVGVFAPVRHPRCAGIAGHQVLPRHARVRVHPEHGVRLASAASTWAMLGSVLSGHRDLVAAGDGIVREKLFRATPPPLATMDQLHFAMTSGRRVGINRLRAALPRVRTRSASRTESWCRLLLVDAGYDEPDLNWEVWVDGVLIACVDLAYAGLKIAIEYEGEHHLRDAAQWAKDIARHEELAAHGWIVIRVTKEQLFGDPDGVVARVARAIRSRM